MFLRTYGPKRSRDAARAVTLLLLDTSKGKGQGWAVALQARLGLHLCGAIPDQVLDPDGAPMKNAIFYKTLAPRG